MPAVSKKVAKKAVAKKVAVQKAPVPKAATTIQVRTRPSVARRVRAGIIFDRQFKVLDMKALSKEQLAALRADPYLETKG